MSNRPFAWSYSKLKNFETCGKRYHHIDVLKDVREEESEELAWGNRLHDALAKAIAHGAPLSKVYKDYEKWAGVVRHAQAQGWTILVEQKLALTQDLEACDFFDRRVPVWFRGIADVLMISPDGTEASVIDWKTGKRKDDLPQLALTAQCVFSKYDTVSSVQTRFVWLKDGTMTKGSYTRPSMATVWAELMPRVNALTKAHQENRFPARPSGLCKMWCPVTMCQHHGVG